MRIATWNVNSIRTRVGRVVDWLVRNDIDVLGMQEIKCRPDQFPREAFEAAGYQLEIHGLNQWNGVAFASRLPMDDVVEGFDNVPMFGAKPHIEARSLAVTVEGIRLYSLYVPNGRGIDDPHYSYKLEWLKQLANVSENWIKEHPDSPLALMGDFNIAPLDTDVWDIGFFEGSTHVTAPERAAFQRFLDLGMIDLGRERVPVGYTYWDYQQLRFPRNEGMRIDFILGTPAFDSEVVDVWFDREERKGDGPSDHVPVVVELASDDDDSPMVF
ncbi:MAG: exodeoxyribonuclease III [Microbacteriaceae bacterium]